MSEVLCSTGALLGRPNHRDYHLLREVVGHLACDGYEFMMYNTWYDQVDHILKVLKELKLSIPVMHCEKQIGQAIGRKDPGDWEEALRRFVINLQIANEVGADKIVIHLWDGLISDQCFANNLAFYPELLKKAEEYGVDLLVENVVCNKEDPMKHWCELRKEYPEVHFIFDTKMAAFHNQVELLYQQEYDWIWKEHHIRHYHVNDYGGGYMDWDHLKTLPIGAGSVDFNQFFEYIKKMGYDDTFTVESTAFNSEGIIDTDMLNRCFMYIRDQMK